jgi:hypothetical protein
MRSGKWRWADRAWLETDMPPVFGKEMDDFKWLISLNTGISYFIFPSPFPSPLGGEGGGEGA